MIELTKLNTSRGAPMGRRDEGDISDCDDIAIEWMPFVDGDYDCQGAYWGCGQPMYCAVGYNEDGEEVARTYLRARSRADAWRYLDHGNGPLVLRPETGSIVKQTIASLQDYKAGLPVEDEDIVENLNDEIESLEGWLERRGLV